MMGRGAAVNNTLEELPNLSILIKVNQIKFKLYREKEKSNVSLNTERLHIYCEYKHSGLDCEHDSLADL
jgi:hypothetical protein